MAATVLSAPPARSLPRRVGRLLRGFWRMPLGDKAALLPAWLLLLLAAAALRLVRFKRLAPLLGRPLGAVGCVPLATPRQEARARFVKRAIQRAARVAPLRSDCLPQALAGTLLCRLLGVPTTAHLGVRLGDEPAFLAHAWLCSGRVAVTGGYSFDHYVAVSCFAAPRRR
ncbi:MAG: lasso peptide biosynthesis B2 protein [Novosphingobium sp.]